MPSRPNLTAGTRTRFQRMSDAKLFAGWVASLSESRVGIRTSGPVPVEPGDRFAVEVFGHAGNLQFQAELTFVGGESLEMEVLGEMRQTASQEPVRCAVPGYGAHVAWKGGETKALAADVSLTGVGLQAPKEIPRGAQVSVELSLPSGEVRFDAEVRYCRKTSGEEHPYRVGLLITYLDRINRARWWAQFEDLAA